MDKELKEITPIVSIIIPVYNAGLLINRCLDSILSQGEDIRYEVLLIDDGSTDHSIDIIETYKNRYFRVFRQENTGSATARNRGIQAAKGKYITFLDADDYWEPTFLKTTISYLEHNPKAIAVNVGQNHISPKGNHISPNCLKNMNQPLLIDDFFSFWAQYRHVCTGSAMLRSDVVKTIGYQRTDLKSGEDWEFWLMVATYGKWALIPEVLFTSDGGMTTQEIGWINKMLPRWENAPKVSVWEKRLLKRLPLPLPKEYLKCRGYIAQDLILSQILSKRYKLSFTETNQYKKDFPKNAMSNLFKACSCSYVLWYFMSKLLIYREYHRKV